MRIVRAILGRFARFLVRVARTLDPGLVATPYWVIPERMAALRQRYPGAPEHWLELIARRTTLGDTADPRSPDPHPAAPADDQHVQPGSPSHPQPLLTNFFRKRDRPAPRFPQPGTKLRRQAEPPNIAARTAGADWSAPVQGAPQSAQRKLSFGAKFVRNPIANLLRIDRPARRASPQYFDATERPNRSEPQRDGEQIGIGRHEHATFFPDLTKLEVRALEPSSVRDGPACYPLDLRWPVLTRRAPDPLAWRDEPRAGTRSDATFVRNDPRWPELPPLAVEWGSSEPSAHDEIGLLAEQIGGAWSE